MLILINSLRRFASLTLLMWAGAHTRFGRIVMLVNILYAIVAQCVKIDSSNILIYSVNSSSAWIYLMIDISNSLNLNFVFVYLVYCLDI